VPIPTSPDASILTLSFPPVLNVNTSLPGKPIVVLESASPLIVSTAMSPTFVMLPSPTLNDDTVAASS